MRLLERTPYGDFVFREFGNKEIPAYAILSHTWSTNNDEEVSFQDIEAGTGKSKVGWRKIQFCARKAAANHLRYFWIDTCCIDKRSSAELSESINSMYRWYQQAKICFAYIEDWPPELSWADLISTIPSEQAQNKYNSKFRTKQSKSRKNTQLKSLSSTTAPLRWFTRGWTLQELIAPRKLEFFDKTWNSRGMKSDHTVITNLSRITGIAHSVLSDGGDNSLRSICHGQRMSWAAYRETSRVEDIAYCLLGIFQINMPLLYGEGENAFVRLQEEILKFSTDLSLLAWTQTEDDFQQYRGIFSRHPLEFRELGQCRLDRSQFSPREEITMTNKGARMETSLFQIENHSADNFPIKDVHILSLGCRSYRMYHDHDDSLQGIYLKETEDVFVRAEPLDLVDMRCPMRRAEARTVYLARDFDIHADHSYNMNENLGIEVWWKSAKPYKLTINDSWPRGYYNHHSDTFVVGCSPHFIGYLVIDVTNSTLNHSIGRGLVASFKVLIIKNGHSNVVVKVCAKDDTKFEMCMGSFAALDSRASCREIVKRTTCLVQDFDEDVIMRDHVSESLLRIKGEIFNRLQVSIGDETFQTKVVQISVSVDR